MGKGKDWIGKDKFQIPGTSSGVLAHLCHPSTFETSLGYRVRLCLKTKIKTTTKVKKETPENLQHIHHSDNSLILTQGGQGGPQEGDGG